MLYSRYHLVATYYRRASFETLLVAPTNCREHNDDSDRFYDKLRIAIDQTPPHNLLTVLGDFNAKISSAHARYALDKRTNENGMRLVDLTCEKSLIITNNNLLKKDGK